MPRRASERRLNVFSLSFLDVMSCGFGAVVLVFLIINHRIDDEGDPVDRDVLAELRQLDYQIATGEENLRALAAELETRRRRVEDARQRFVAATADRERHDALATELEARAAVDQDAAETLKADVDSREQDVERLRAVEETASRNDLRAVEGEGDRQYLTGLFVGGRHVLIALDASASMLDRTIVQVVRRRNMARARQLAAPKWQRAQRTVEWIAAQLPIDGNFQVAVFSTEVEFLLPGSTWHEAAHPTAIDDALAALAERVPAGGTNLDALVDAILAMSPRPDNVFLITDGLPTRSARAPRGATIDGRERVRLFTAAARRVPKDVPINTILFPLEGDPQASSGYWGLAVRTGGTYMAPSADWP